ncbi:MAG TPA: lysophospholipid acyltransferase family protein [Gemmataceae bacterium]|nr:lysophospholipid acyltransferase family protein [Gemmataceae bacterium]
MWAVAVGLLATAGLLGAWRRSGLPLFDLTALHAFRAYARLWHGVPRRGTRQLPAKGPALLIANHTCSADPAILQTCCPRPLCFLIAREYYHLPVARRFFGHFGMVPVARNGRDITALRVGLRRLAEGRVVCLFPEGGLSGAGTGRVRPGRGGAALLALRSGAPVYPAFIAGGPQHSHIARAWLLPSRARVVVGEPVDLSAYRDRPLDRRLIEEVAALLMRRVAELDPNRRHP